MNPHQSFEQQWWGTCANTYGEETKQLTYAHRMGLRIAPDNGHWPVYDLERQSVLDLGGGPVSILLKTKRLTGIVVDPCAYPRWVSERYAAAGILYFQEPAETFATTATFDECWIYNVLQHVVDPAKIIEVARRYACLLRIFEWIDMPPHLGHPHMLTEPQLNEWVGAKGRTEQMNENGCVGRAWYGAFSTR